MQPNNAPVLEIGDKPKPKTTSFYFKVPASVGDKFRALCKERKLNHREMFVALVESGGTGQRSFSEVVAEFLEHVDQIPEPSWPA